LPFFEEIRTRMTITRLWVYDGILASGVAGPTDVFTAANRLGAGRAMGGRAPFQKLLWRVESLDGRPVRTALGQVSRWMAGSTLGGAPTQS
jgi:hypothetical protein